MTANISSIEAKINNYIVSHPELAEKARDYVISIMLKDSAITAEEAKLLEQPSIYSNPFSIQNGEYVSSQANDSFICNNTTTGTPIEAKTNSNLPIPGLKTDSAGNIDRRQFSVKELLKKYEPPEYKIERSVDKNQQEEIFITNSKRDIAFFLMEFDNGNYKITQNDKNKKYEAFIINGQIHNCQITKENSNGSYTITDYRGTVKNTETSYDQNGNEINKTNFVVSDLIKSVSENDTSKLSSNILNKVSKLNIDETLNDYKSKTGKDFINDIVTNPNINEDEKTTLMNHLISNYKGKEFDNYEYSSYIFNAIDEDITNSDTQGLITHLKFVNNQQAAPIIKELEKGTALNDDIKLKIYSLYTDYDENYENGNSRVKNKYNKGTTYKIKQNKDYTIDVYSWATGKTTKVNLKNLCKDIPVKLQPQFFEVIQKLPGEVLMDINSEASLNFTEKGIGNDGRSYFDPNNDTINVTLYQIDENTIIHELGHAVDFNTNYKKIDDINEQEIENAIFYNTEKSEIEEIYNREKQEYINAGNKAHNEEVNYNAVTKKHEKTIEEGPYCTWNIHEFFAESYGLMMIGEPADEKSKECIEKYFPKTFAAVKAELVKIRKKPLEERH